MKKKPISIIITLLLFVPFLSSCNKNQGNTNETSSKVVSSTKLKEYVSSADVIVELRYGDGSFVKNLLKGKQSALHDALRSEFVNVGYGANAIMFFKKANSDEQNNNSVEYKDENGVKINNDSKIEVKTNENAIQYILQKIFINQSDKTNDVYKDSDGESFMREELLKNLNPKPILEEEYNRDTPSFLGFARLKAKADYIIRYDPDSNGIGDIKNGDDKLSSDIIQSDFFHKYIYDQGDKVSFSFVKQKKNSDEVVFVESKNKSYFVHDKGWTYVNGVGEVINIRDLMSGELNK